MLHADLQRGNTVTGASQDARGFKYLPAYAQFLLDHHLEAFASSLLRLSRKLDIPLLRYFAAWPEEKLLELGKEGNLKLLSALAQNRIEEYIGDQLRTWLNNQLPLVQSDEIVIEDISKVNFTRRQVFREFLLQYTTEPASYIAIMEEVDLFTLQQEDAYYKTLFDIKEQKIREHHHFIDKITNTSPGILYVFDLVEGKQTYANHKQQEMLGYSREELEGMAGRGIMAEIVHPEDRPLVAQHYAEFRHTGDGEIRIVEYRVRHKDGHYSWQRGYEAVFRRNEAGQACEIIGVALDVTSEKEASIRLEHRESQLREAQELAGIGSFDWDLIDGSRSDFSPQLFKIFEMDGPGNLMAFLEHVHPADRQGVRAAIARAISDGDVYESEYRYRKKGPEKVIWSRGKVRFEHGRAVSLKGTVMDVTLRHDMLKRLERSEQLHKQAQALTHLGNWTWTLSDDKVEWSDEMYRIFGLVPQSETMALGRIMSLIHPEDRTGRYEALHLALKTGHTDDYTMRIVTEDGTLKFVEGKTEVLVDEHGQPYKIIGTCQDVTRQHLLNEKLRENEEASSQLINNAPEAIVVIDESSHIVFWNPKAEETFGWASDEIQGSCLTDTIIPEAYRAQHIAGIERLRATGVSRVLNKTIEVTALKKNGEAFYISLTVSRSMWAGKPVFIAFIRDISNEKATEQKLMEQRSQLARKNRELEHHNQELTAFNYIASHDLQEPVRKIQVFSNLILDSAADSLPAQVKDSIERISAAANHMHRLIDALIAFSRATTVDQAYEPADLNAILEEVKGLLRDKIEEHGASVITAPLPVLPAIPFQIQQLFENLISNALKYRRQDVSPVIRISSEIVPGAQLQDTGIDGNTDYCRLSISDNGIGFDQQYATKVFELFQRLHDKHAYAGTGIGLAICKKIVQNHDGFISAQSRIGMGTTFEILLPAHGTQS